MASLNTKENASEKEIHRDGQLVLGKLSKPS